VAADSGREKTSGGDVLRKAQGKNRTKGPERRALTKGELALTNPVQRGDVKFGLTRKRPLGRHRNRSVKTAGEGGAPPEARTQFLAKPPWEKETSGGVHHAPADGGTNKAASGKTDEGSGLLTEGPVSYYELFL